MSDVLFDTGSYTLKPGAREKLAKISGIVLAHPGLNLQIEGHTDSVGSDEMNQQLSERRADSVRDFLAQQGVAGSSISARGFGKTQPVAGNELWKAAAKSASGAGGERRCHREWECKRGCGNETITRGGWLRTRIALLQSKRAAGQAYRSQTTPAEEIYRRYKDKRSYQARLE